MTEAADAAAAREGDQRRQRSEAGAAARRCGVRRDKKPGTLRVGVPEVANKTTQTVDTRALRARLIAELEEQKIDAIPMAAAPPAALDARATELGVDYLLVAEVTELKASKPGGLTKDDEEHRR